MQIVQLCIAYYSSNIYYIRIFVEPKVPPGFSYDTGKVVLFLLTFDATQEYITLITNFINVTFVIGDHT